ncbi:ComF family protein [Alteromonas ponticola]|uniref:ComF family protein n=1 Tax=Alteromonas ponticola TaxID=2720613 RepID=A0ABX1R5J4_9ALTE|nr:ComF family protein [Alteromonas ponticola]NMH60747.1 ComF family protein [Alteromonas ponticola]
MLKRLLPNLACILCNQHSNSAVCDFCKNDTAFFYDPDKPTNLLHRPEIARHVKHSAIDGLYAIGPYQWPLNQLLLRLKTSRDMRPAGVMAEWFVCAMDDMCLPDQLLPVPITYWRYFQRRYNQSVELAKLVGQPLNLPINTQWARRKSARQQTGLNRQQRLQNLRQAYEVVNTPPCAHVAIVDDVITTGSTVDVLAKQLRLRHPHIKIDVWTMAVTLAH